jgi:aminotransferase in exopolysaccharide biosynthesis
MQPLNIETRIVEAIQSVTGVKSVPLHEPHFSGNEWSYLKECLDSTFVSSVGKYVDKFERDLEKFLNVKRAVAVVNGTSALHIALKLAGVAEGEEVLIPTLTFVATANAVSYCNAIPHFVDSETSTLGIDAEKLRRYLTDVSDLTSGACVNRKTGRTIRAIVVVHIFGHAADLDQLLLIAKDFKLKVIEDAAESLGTTYRGRHTGTFGLLGVMSFNGNKIATTGGGGAVVTNDEDLGRLAKHLTTTAKLQHTWEFRHDLIGYNYRMPNINAAIGCAQLENIAKFVEAKRALFKRYQDAFNGLNGVTLMNEPGHCRSNFWLQTIKLDPALADRRDSILQATNAANIMTRPCWVPMHRLEPYKICPRMDLSTADSLYATLINIPSSANLALSQQ